MRQSKREAPQWSSFAEALGLVARGRTVRTALPVALFVGTVLSLVNEGTAEPQGRFTLGVILRVITNFVVPFCVASYGYLSASRRSSDGERAGLK